MARRKFRNNQRYEQSTDRSFSEYLLTAPAAQTTRAELMRLVDGGEDTYLELKVKLSNPEKIAQGVVALANTGGGLIIFGVSDQLRVEGLDDPEAVQDELVRICREDVVPQIVPYIDSIAFDNGRRIIALEVKGARRPYRTRDGRYYIRLGDEKREASSEELAALMDDARPFTYEAAPALGARLEDIDEAHLWSFVREFEGDRFISAGAADYPTADVLERDLLLGTRYGEAIVPTVAGLLLFGRNERVPEVLPRSCVFVARYAGETVQSPVIEETRIAGNLHTLYEESLRFIKRYCDLWDKRPARANAAPDTASGISPVVARGNYHQASIIEALSNALVHRDLVLRDHPTRINIFDRSVEFINARRTAGFSQVANRAIRYGVPQRLNPQLAALFANPAYGTSPSTNGKFIGLPMILRESRLFNGRAPDINLVNDEFRLRLYAN